MKKLLLYCNVIKKDYAFKDDYTAAIKDYTVAIMDCTVMQ